MRVAVVGSRTLEVKNLEEYLPDDTTEIISGGAKGVDASVRRYALQHGIKFKEVLPEYERYGRGAPIKRNDIIISMADMVLVFWDGKSRGSGYVIEKCRKKQIPCRVYTHIPEP